MIDTVELELCFAPGPNGTVLVTAQRQVPRSDSNVVSHGETAIRIDLVALFERTLDPEEYGRQLFTDLFGPFQLRVALERAVTHADALGLPLRLRLTIAPTLPQLHRLAWETIVETDTGRPLLSERITLVRTMHSADSRPTVVPIRSSLRSLAVIASPRGIEAYNLSPLHVPQERANAQQFLRTTTLSTLAGTGAATPAALIAALRDGVDILYLVAHGTMVQERPVLWLEREDGTPAPIYAQVLADQIAALPRLPRLIVIVSCGSATDETMPIGAALGPQLAAAGVPAVIAMQGRLSVAGAQALMPTLFRELQRDGHIDRALAAARTMARLAGCETDWWRPTLYLRAREARLWRQLSRQLEPPTGFTSRQNAAAPSPYHWVLHPSQQQQLVDLFASRCGLHTAESRQRLLARLPPALRAAPFPADSAGAARVLVTLAQRITWGMEALMDAADASEGSESGRNALADLLGRIRPQPISFSQLRALKAILGGLRFEEPLLRACYAAVTPSDDPPLADTLHRGLMICILDRLAQLPIPEGGPQPLLRILADLVPRFPSSVRAEVVSWIRATAGAIGSDVPQESGFVPAASRAPVTLLVELAPHGEQTYLVQAWLWGERQDLLYAEDTPLSLAVIRETLLPQLYEDIVDDVIRGGSDLLVEFFLPFRLIDERVEQWNLGGEPLGIRHHVVIRSQERAHSRLYWPLWHRRWEEIGDLARPLDRARLAQVRVLDECRQGALRKRLDQAAVLALACGLPSTEDVRRGIIQALLASGTPIALWSHPPSAAPGDEEMDELFARAALASLPEVVRQRRLDAFAAEAAEAPTGLALLWDDPSRLPQRLPRLAAPALTGGLL